MTSATQTRNDLAKLALRLADSEARARELEQGAQQHALQLAELAARQRRAADAAEIELDRARADVLERIGYVVDAVRLLTTRSGIPRHEWDGTKLRFENPNGTWGQWTDLQGPRGARGSGGGRFDLATLPIGDTSTPEQIIVEQHGTWARISWAAFLDLIGAVPYTPSLDFSDARNSQYIGAVHL